jgi:hypothetical protein
VRQKSAPFGTSQPRGPSQVRCSYLGASVSRLLHSSIHERRPKPRRSPVQRNLQPNSSRRLKQGRAARGRDAASVRSQLPNRAQPNRPLRAFACTQQPPQPSCWPMRSYQTGLRATPEAEGSASCAPFGCHLAIIVWSDCDCSKSGASLNASLRSAGLGGGPSLTLYNPAAIAARRRSVEVSVNVTGIINRL